MVEFFDLYLLLAVGFAFISAISQGYAGFGGGLVIVPILAILFGPIEAIAITTVAALAGNFILVPDSLKKANWREVAPASIGMASAVPLGLLFLTNTDPDLIRTGMGIFVILAAVILMSGWTYPGKRNRIMSFFFGALTGGVTGGFGIPGGPFIILYFMSSPDTAAIKRANIIVVICIGMILMLTGMIINDAYTETTLLRTALIVPAFMLGAALGRYLFKIAEVTWYKKVSYLIFIITGVSILII